MLSTVVPTPTAMLLLRIAKRPADKVLALWRIGSLASSVGDCQLCSVARRTILQVRCDDDATAGSVRPVNSSLLINSTWAAESL